MVTNRRALRRIQESLAASPRRVGPQYSEIILVPISPQHVTNVRSAHSSRGSDYKRQCGNICNRYPLRNSGNGQNAFPRLIMEQATIPNLRRRIDNRFILRFIVVVIFPAFAAACQKGVNKRGKKYHSRVDEVLGGFVERVHVHLAREVQVLV